MRIENCEVKAESCVNLLGVYFDQQLNFDGHIDDLCRKVGRNLIVLARLPRHYMYQAKKKSMLLFILFDYHTLNTVNQCGTFEAGKTMKKLKLFKSSLCDMYIL